MYASFYRTSRQSAQQGALRVRGESSSKKISTTLLISQEETNVSLGWGIIGTGGFAGNTTAPAFIPGSPTTLTRPLCPYPQTAVYNGSGNVNDAANWQCGGDLEKNIPVGTPLSGRPGQPVACYDVLAKYKHEVKGPLDFEGSGVDPAICQALH